MRNLFSIIILILFSTLTVCSQNLNIEWAKSTATYGTDFYIDSTDNVITTGYFDNTVDFDPGPGVFNLTSNGSCYYITKLDSSGNFLWAFMYSAQITVSGIYILPSGNFQAVLDGNAAAYDIDPGPGVVNVTGDCVVKYSANGQYISHIAIWIEFIGMYNSNFIRFGYTTTAMDIDPGPGTFFTTANSVFIANFDTSMNFVSAVNYPSSLYPEKFQMMPGGNFIFSGEYDSPSLDLIPGPAVVNLPLVIPNPSSSRKNYFVATTDHNFNPISTTSFASISIGTFYEIHPINDGSLVISTEVSNGDTIYPASGNTGIRIVNNTSAFMNYGFIKYNNGGQYVRNIRLPIEDLDDVEIDGSARMNITGGIGFPDTWDFDPSGAVYNIVDNDPGCSNIYIAMYDTTFSFKGAYMMGGDFCNVPLKMISKNNGDVIYLGASHSHIMDVDVTFGTYIVPEPLPAPNSGFFVAKYNTSTFNNVWPGDANQDLIVDNYDILSIGLYNGEATDKRFTISNLWQPYFAFMYGIAQYNGSDIQHADCNGNGTITISDTTAIRQNYGMSHVQRQAQSNRVAVGPDLYFQTTATAVGPGSIVNVDIMVGTSNLSLYGLGFNIPIDPSLIQPGTVSLTFAPSWLGTPGTNAIKFGKFTGISVDGTLVRNNQTNATGFGKIATMTFQVANSISTPTTFPLSFSNYLALTANGSNVPLTPLTNSFIVDPLLEVPTLGAQVSMSIYPNVTSDVFTLEMQLNNAADAQFTLINVVGELVSEIESIQFAAGTSTKEFNISSLSKGIYFLKSSVNGNVSYNRIVKL